MNMKFSLALVATVFAAACSSNNNTITAPDPTVTVTTVTVTGLAAISSDTQLTASAQFSDRTARDVTALASWTTSNAALATVSSTGVVTAVGTGQVELRATYQNVAGVIQVAVTLPAAPLTYFLTGFVFDGSTGLPLGGVNVQVVGDSSGGVTTGQPGIYRLEGLLAGRILVEFTKDGYQLLEISVEMTEDRREDVSLNPDVP